MGLLALPCRLAGLNDATYLHTPNPNGSSFPIQPEGLDWDDDRLPPVFKDLISEHSLRIGHLRQFDVVAVQ